MAPSTVIRYSMIDVQGVGDEVGLIDNDGATPLPAVLGERQNLHIERLHGHGNIGYGRGHNLTLNRTAGFHLILNPDVECAPDALIEALAFMLAKGPRINNLLIDTANIQFINDFLCSQLFKH